MFVKKQEFPLTLISIVLYLCSKKNHSKYKIIALFMTKRAQFLIEPEFGL